MADQQQTNNTTSITIPKIGMNTDSALFNLQRGEYQFALNASVEDFDGIGMPQLQSTASNILETNILDGYKVIGFKYIMELEKTLIMLVDPINNLSDIGYINDVFYDDDKEDPNGVNNCCDCSDKKGYSENKPLEKITQLPYKNYVSLTSTDCLNFNIDNPIDIEYKIIGSELHIYFVDNLNPFRYLYFDIEGNDLILQDIFKVTIGTDPNNCDLPIYSQDLDCNKIKFNPEFSTPCINAKEISIGGNIKAGTVQGIVCYADALGIPRTHYFPASETVSIKTKNINVLTDYLTDQSIFFKVSGLEQSGVFTHYNLVVAETVDNFTTFKLAATLPITQSEYLYTGNNIIKNLTSNDIFFQRPIYKTGKSLTSANDYLFAANLKEQTKLNLQQAVARIPVYWQTKSVPENFYKDGIQAGKYRSFLRDEVYALGIVFEMFDDNDSIVFPLVAPSKQYFLNAYNINVDEIIDNNDVITDSGCTDIILNKKWQCYNLAQLVGTPHLESGNCDDANCWEWGDFSYWESTDKYPNIPEVWGNLCNTPIRHFKFPDCIVSHIHDNEGDLSPTYLDKNRIFPLGIKIDHTAVLAALSWAVNNNLITQQQRDQIKGYRIVRSNRVGNKSVTAKGLLYDMWKYDRDGNTHYYPNYPYNDLRPDNFISNTNATYDEINTSDPIPNTFTPSKRYTFHSPDTHFTMASLGSILKLETEEYGKAEGFFNHCEEQSKYVLLSTVSRTLCFAAGVAAAFSSITKTCRSIEDITTFPTVENSAFTATGTYNYTDVYGNVVGSSPGATATTPITVPLTGSGTGSGSNVNTIIEAPDPSVITYNGLTPGVNLATHRVTKQDCKGTTFQWLSPAHLIPLATTDPGVVGIMAGVLAVANGISEALYMFSIMMKEMDLFAQLIESLAPKKNLGIQYNSIGKYTAFTNVGNNGNKQRLLDSKEYLLPNNVITEDSSYINNWHRETSVYLKTNGITLPSPTNIDSSRNTMSTIFGNNAYDNLNTKFYTNISSYYAALKLYRPNQYGSIYNIEYLETDGCPALLTDDISTCRTYFGGDTFINRFALKIKHPFFIQTRFNQLDGIDVRYSELGNAGYPNYYFDTDEGYLEKLSNLNIGDIFSKLGGFLQDLVGTDDSRMDAKTAKFFYQNGYIHLYSYGIPYFLCESDVNVDYRHGEDNMIKDFYPHHANISEWLQEKNVPIREDNYYFYNSTYSKQNKESALPTLTPNYYDFTLEKNNDLSNRIIYSEKTYALSENDNWLIFKGNNFYDYDKKAGKVISVDGIEQDKILVRNENLSQIFNAYDLVKMETGTFQTGVGGIFESRPKNFAITDLGYMATQHKGLIQTEFGHVWVDAKRGQVFLLQSNAGAVEEISRNNMRNWFRENLPFEIKKYLPTLSDDDLDNNFKGLGISISFDRRFSRLFLTKLDYKPLKSNITYDSSDKKFYISIDRGREEVQLTDTEYFCSKCWTISYNFLTKTWVSFHSFTPNYYIDHIDYLSSGVNGINSNIWGHNLTNKSYGVYYGKLSPFIIDLPTEPQAGNSLLTSLEYTHDTVRYHNKFNPSFNREITFNKAIVYNDFQNSGLLELNVLNQDDLSLFMEYPKPLKDRIKIEVTNSENIWKLNDFYDVVYCQKNNMPTWIKDCNNVNKNLNTKAFDYSKTDLFQPRMRGKLFNLRLINDKYSNHKFVFYFGQFNKERSFR